MDAADAIKSLTDQLAALQTENAELREENGCLQHNVAAMYATLDQQAKNCEALLAEKDKEIERLRAKAKQWRQTSEENFASCEKLQAALSRVKAERDAAVKDMKLMADKAREEHRDDVPCFACRFDCDMSIMPSGDFANECPGFDKEDCFKWRGAQGEE